MNLRFLPLVTEKSMALSSTGKYQFIVPTWATKNEISEVINGLFDVTVDSITTARYGAKSVRFKQKAGSTSAYKKATITLIKGQTISDFALPIEKETENRHSDASSSRANSNETREPEVKTESQITVRSRSKKKDA